MTSRILASTLAPFVLFLGACSGGGPAGPDADAIAANNRGVGLMGRFEYANAQSQFRELAERYPGWHEVKLNLAIATLNTQKDGSETAAFELAQDVLADDGENLRAHYISGLVKLYLGLPDEALTYFEFVATRDAGDAYAAYYTAQCHAQLGEYEDAIGWYEKAMALDPYLRSAYYGAFQSLQRLRRPDEARLLAAEYQRLENNPRSQLAEFKYTRMGPKGGTLTVDLDTAEVAPMPTGSLFVAPEPVPIDSARPIAWRAGDARPPGITTVDMQADGTADLFLTGAVDGAAPNLVLYGNPAGGYTAIENHPLATVGGVNAALWGDYDNDGLVDVYLCRNGANQLWRQTETDIWEDVTASTGTAGGDLDTVDGAFFDADHDGDLDLFLVNADGANELLNNNLNGTFRTLAADYGLAGGEASLVVLPADIDSDRDADIIVINGSAPHDVYINDRLWSYRQAEGYDSFRNRPAVTVLAADVDADGLPELYTLTPAGELLRWVTGDDGNVTGSVLASPASLADSANAALSAYDVSGDGQLELIVSSTGGWEVLAIAGDSVDVRHSAAGPAKAAVPMIGRSTAGPVVLSLDADGLAVTGAGPGRNPFVTMTLSGRQDDAESMRSNASGIGAQVGVRTGSRWSLLQSYRNATSPGQSLQPLAVGLGGAARADFVAIDWSDGVFQSEVLVPTGELTRITETQRQLSSCPVLFAWNGTEHVFVSDILGVGGIGYSIGPGQYTTPRPRESYLLPDGLLQPKEGRYVLKIGEPMEENAYIDAARLAVYDLPTGWQIVLDERMGLAPPEPTGEARFFRHEVLPRSASNDRGEDVTASVIEADGVAAPIGELDHRFIGRLEREHVLTLDFIDPIEHDAGVPMLVIDGWVEYPYSQTNFAAWQAGATYVPPTLEAFADGDWQVIAEHFGYPAGMPRRMSMPLDNLPAGTTRLRLSTNQQIYWDRVSVAFAEDIEGVRKQVLPVAAATVRKTGFAKRSTYEQFRPFYDYGDLLPFWDTRYMAGNYTRLGPVLQLVADVDDAVAIIGPGEEVHLEFDAVAPAPNGFKRHYVVESNGWAKDMDLFTRDGETVGPLPYRGDQPTAASGTLHDKYNTRYQAGF